MTGSTASDTKVSKKGKKSKATAADGTTALTDKEADAVKGGFADLVVIKSTDKASPP